MGVRGARISKKPEAHFPPYNAFLSAMDSVNTTVMGLIVGSELAARTLELTRGSKLSIREIFPDLRHVDRFNLPPSAAMEVLQDAPAHIAPMTIPYAMAHMEELVVAFAEIGHTDMAPGWNNVFGDDQPPRDTTVEILSTAQPEIVPKELLFLYQYVRKLRNFIVHGNGVATSDFVRQKWEDSPGNALGIWQRWSRSRPRMVGKGECLKLGQGEIVGTFAMVRALANRLCFAAASMLSNEYWCEEVLQHPEIIDAVGNESQALRRVPGVVRPHFPALTSREGFVELVQKKKLAL